MLQLIDDVLSYKPPLRIDDSTGIATLTLKTTNKDTSTKDEKNADVAKEEANTTDNNDTLASNQLHKIYGEEVFNKADDLIEDSPSIPNAARGKKVKRRRKKGSSKFRPIKGCKKGDYTYKPKNKPRVVKVNAAVSISDSSSTAGTDEEPEDPLSQAEEHQLIFLILMIRRCTLIFVLSWTSMKVISHLILHLICSRLMVCCGVRIVRSKID
jgi:hypothetical protein